MLFSELKDKYLRNDSGQYAIMMAILGLPLIMGISAAVDFTAAQSEYTDVKNALDNAVLAAATNNRVALATKEKIAKTHFQQNYNGRANVTLTAKAEGDVVEMTADGLVPFSVAEALGLNGIEIVAESAARRTEENVICVLALSEENETAISFSGDIEFFAPTCSVHSNSPASHSIHSTSSRAPVAKSFCATGGVRGSFSPYAKGECLKVEDPYEHVESPAVSQCDLRSMLGTSGVFGSVTSGTYQNDRLNDWVNSGGANFTGDNAVIKPGTYCGGLFVDGRNVEFLPGDYVIKDGPLVIMNGAQVEGRGVTFGFLGNSAVLNISKGAEVDFKAPSSGPREGLVFMEMAGDTFWDRFAEVKQHEISSGGKLNITGTAYFPNQSILVNGSGTEMGAEAPATSFIAKTLAFNGENSSKVQVKVDHRAADLPPLLPRSEDGAFLIR